MSYREENGQVILTMSREDYEHLLFVIANAHGVMFETRDTRPELEFMNRLNSGNPNYTPYQAEGSTNDSLLGRNLK